MLYKSPWDDCRDRQTSEGFVYWAKAELQNACLYAQRPHGAVPGRLAGIFTGSAAEALYRAYRTL